MSGDPKAFEQSWNNQVGWAQPPVYNPPPMQTYSSYRADEMVVNAEQLSFHQSKFQQEVSQPEGTLSPDAQTGKMAFFYDKGYDYSKPGVYDYSKPGSVPVPGGEDFESEPPLLEELGIEPDQILKKTMVVLDPFHSSVPLGEYDLAGPLLFCLFLALTMLVSGGKINFSYVYGLAVTGCLLMYCLLWLMTSGPSITVMSVASVLGYSLLPVVILSAISIFVSLNTHFGYGLAGIAVTWASLAASRMFVTMSADSSQRPLIAYPCGLLYAVFTLLVLF